jgi:hypothetical protein
VVPQISRFWWALPVFDSPLKDPPWLATWDTFWTIPFVQFLLPPWKSSHWETWNKRSTSPNHLLIHAVWSGLLHIRLPTHQVTGAVTCSRPNKSAFCLVCQGGSVLEDSLPKCSPSYPVQVQAGCLDFLSNSTGHLFQPLSTPRPQVLAPLPMVTWMKSIGKSLEHAWIDQSAVSTKAAKSDGARVSTHMWDCRILLPSLACKAGSHTCDLV